MAQFPALASLLLEAAQAVGAKCDAARPELTGERFNLELTQGSTPLQLGSRRFQDLPQVISGARLDDIPVLIGELKGPPIKPAIEGQMRLYRNQAAIARSWLVEEAPNLQLFLIGPEGALASAQWRQIAAEIEADDRTCRKLVWLFDKEPDQAEAQGFLTRTFVARPWPTATSQVSLDAVASYSLPKGWEEAVQDPTLDFEGLVARLIQLEGSV